jgi:hypothetical protein
MTSYRYDPGELAVIVPIAKFSDLKTKAGCWAWQPIETAPHDGTHIIGWIPPDDIYGGIVGIFWEAPYKRMFDGHEITMGGEWLYSVHDQMVAEPTHWMPMPPLTPFMEGKPQA